MFHSKPSSWSGSSLPLRLMPVTFLPDLWRQSWPRYFNPPPLISSHETELRRAGVKWVAYSCGCMFSLHDLVPNHLFIWTPLWQEGATVSAVCDSASSVNWAAFHFQYIMMKSYWDCCSVWIVVNQLFLSQLSSLVHDGTLILLLIITECFLGCYVKRL